MKQIFLTITMLFMLVGTMLGQRTVTGTVSGDDGETLIGATIRVKGANIGTVTSGDGKYTINIPSGATTLMYSYSGFDSQELLLGASNIMDVTMKTASLQEVVVTAFGVERYKNELAYSAQKVEGAALTNTRDANVVNALSGRVAGLNIKRNNSLGGSTNVVLRGNKSLTGDNQALFVIDGVPVDNSNTNSAGQQSGRQGYDYGNAANDINADNIESVSVLKGAAASALYGSRAANGVVIITTKKGSKNKGIGVSVNLGANMGKVDKSTFITYQKKYGAGYGPFYEDASGFFWQRDINGDGTGDLVTPLTEDASWGAKFDPSLQVYQWDAFDPFSPNFGKSRPWVAGANDPNAFFETAAGTSNGVSINGTDEKGYFNLGYTRTTDKGIMPNSHIGKNMVNFGSSYALTSKLKVFSSINFTSTEGKGRYGTGYDSRNLMTNFRQWWQTNVDILEQKEAYERKLSNVTWNLADVGTTAPIYWDNPYWTRHENYQNDQRNRYLGYVGTTFSLTSWLDLTGRIALDQYDEIQEERTALTSIDVSEYMRFNRNFRETNTDLFATVKPVAVTSDLKFDAMLGTNLRDTRTNSVRSRTNGGLAIARPYSLANTRNPLLPPTEIQNRLVVNGLFGRAGLIYKNWGILDLSVRRDQASSLPTANNAFFYPAASLGLVFSEFIGMDDAITFGKIRLNYAEVGNTAPPLSINDAYTLNPAMGDAGLATVMGTKNNKNLTFERTKSYEAGIEMRFLKDRVGFDVTYYQMNTIDQIIPVPVSRTTGYNFKYINAGDIENKGVELQLFGRVIHTRDFDWRIDLNWARNRNKVIDLGGIDNLQLASLQGGVTINAALGEPYGTIRGQNFRYLDGQRIIGENGRFLRSATSNEIIGNVNPDWTGGINNTLTYKGVSLGFLIDIRQGGDIFSLDRYYGLATGVAEETAGLNDLGNELRAPLADGGGIINQGVLADGTPNTKRISAEEFGYLGYRRIPAAGFVYDASFVKLREVTLNFAMPAKWFGSSVVRGASLGFYGRNLWIIHKNLPDADPEDGFSSGNVQGYQGGSYPTTRTFGVNLNVNF